MKQCSSLLILSFFVFWMTAVTTADPPPDCREGEHLSWGNGSFNCTDTNECELIPEICGYYTVCHNMPAATGSYTCSCEPYETDNELTGTCVHYNYYCNRDPNLCKQNWGNSVSVTCRNEAEDPYYSCDCQETDGWYNVDALNCNYINECDLYLDDCPWVCKDIAFANDGTHDFSYKCECPEKMFPDPIDGHCKLNTIDPLVEECDTNVCGDLHQCYNDTNGPDNLRCICRRGYIVDPNNDKACIEDDPTDMCPGNSTGSFDAATATLICECDQGFRRSVDGPHGTCEPINPCEDGTNTCDQHAQCVYTGPGNYSCACEGIYYNINTNPNGYVTCAQFRPCNEPTVVCGVGEVCVERIYETDIPGLTEPKDFYKCVCPVPNLEDKATRFFCDPLGHIDHHNTHLQLVDLPLSVHHLPTFETLELLEQWIVDSMSAIFKHAEKMFIAAGFDTILKNSSYPDEHVIRIALYFEDTFTNITSVKDTIIQYSGKTTGKDNVTYAVLPEVTEEGGRLYSRWDSLQQMVVHEDVDSCSMFDNLCDESTHVCTPNPAISGAYRCACDEKHVATGQDVQGHDVCNACSDEYDPAQNCMCKKDEVLEQECVDKCGAGKRCIRDCTEVRCTCEDGLYLTETTGCNDVNECSLVPGLCPESCRNYHPRYHGGIGYECVCRSWHEQDPETGECIKPDSYCAIHPEACHTFFGSYSHGQCIDEPEEPFFSCDCDESTGWYNFADNMCLITDECRLWIDDCPWGCSNIFLDREDSSYRCSCPYGTAGDGYNCHVTLPSTECSAEQKELCGERNLCYVGADGRHRCICRRGYQHHGTGYNEYCSSYDVCRAHNPCGYHSTCNYTMEGGNHKVTCGCQPGYYLDGVWPLGTCRSINPCLTNPCSEDAVCVNTGPNQYQCECQGIYAEGVDADGNKICTKTTPCALSSNLEKCRALNMDCVELDYKTDVTSVGHNPWDYVECRCLPPRVIDSNGDCRQIGAPSLGNTQMYILEFPVVINENPYDEFLFNEHLKANITRSMLATFGVYGMTSATVIHRSKLANSPAEYLIQAALFFNQALPFGEEKPLKLILETELSHIQFHDEIEPLNVYPGGVFYTTSPALVHIDDMMDVNPCYGNIFQQVCPEPVKQLCVHTDGSSGSFSCRCRENYVIESASDDNGNEVCGTCIEGYDPNSNCVCWTAARLDQECSAVCGTGRCIRHCESVECECKHGTVLYTEPGTGVQRCADINECMTIPDICPERCHNLDPNHNEEGLGYECLCQDWQLENAQGDCVDNTDYCTTHPEACHEFPGTYDHGECLPISEVPFYECDCDEATGWYNDGPRLCAPIDECRIWKDNCPWSCKNVFLDPVDSSFACDCPSPLIPDPDVDGECILDPNVLECTTTEQANCGAENLCYRANATTPGQCVCRRGQRRNSVGNRCEVDNPCESTGYNHPCIGSWTTCEFNAANREVTCGCIDGYESDGNLFHPCHAINPCDSNPCLGGSLCVYMAPGQYECQCQGIFQNLNDNGGPVVCEAVSPCSNEIISKSCVDKNMICRDLPYTENVPEIGTNAMDYYECVCKPPRFFDPVTMLCTSLGSDGTEELSLFEMTIPLVLTGDPLNDDLAKVQLEKDIQEAMFEAFGQFGLRESALISVGLWTIDQQERKEELEVYHYAVQDIDYSVDVALYLNEALLPNTGGSPLVDILKTSLGQFDLEDGHSYYLMPGGKLRIPSIAVNDISAFTGIDPCGRDDICEFTEIWECVHNASQSGSFRCVCKSGYESIGLNGGEEQCRDINECLNTRICENLWGDHGANSTICFNQPGKYSCVCSNGYYVNQEGKCEHVPGVTLGTTEQSPNTSDGTGSPPTAESTTGIPSTTEDPGDVASTLCSNCLVIFSVFLAQFLFQFAN